MKNTSKSFNAKSVIAALLAMAFGLTAMPSHAADQSKTKQTGSTSRSYVQPDTGLRDGDSCGCFEASGGLVPDDVVPLVQPKKTTKASPFIKSVSTSTNERQLSLDQASKIY